MPDHIQPTTHPARVNPVAEAPNAAVTMPASTAPIPGTTSNVATYPLAAPSGSAAGTPRPPNHSSSSAVPRLLDDNLGKLVYAAWNRYRGAPNWDSFVRQTRQFSDLSPSVAQLPHRASHLLDVYRRTGVPIQLSTPPWDFQRKSATLLRGPHRSAHDHVDFLRGEFTTMIQRGQWTVLPASAVLSQPGLRLSPLGVVPQRERRPRTIVDYSYWNVNQETCPLAPHESMQFGRTFLRLLRHLATANPVHGPVYLSKTDIADGFYRIALSPFGVLALGVVFPSSPGEEPLIAFPLTLPMGWVNSPPCFTALTETVADLVNQRTQEYLPPHRLESMAATQGPLDVQAGKRPQLAARSLGRRPLRGRPLRHTDVYVDDFVQLAQGDPQRRTSLIRTLLHTLDQVLRPLEPADGPWRQEPASVKKYSKGDGAWSTQKILLGWLFDTIAGTVSLPAHRRTRLRELLALFHRGRHRAAASAWHQLLGELRSMALGIPGARGLFSTLQEGLRAAADGPRIRLTRAIHDTLDDFRYLESTLDARPSRYFELVDQPPAIIGASDASGSGMGGVFFLHLRDGTVHPFLWRQPFSPAIRAELVSFSNPSGRLNNSQLELVGVLAHRDAVCQACDPAETTIQTLCDNTAAVAWDAKGSATSAGPVAYLLRTGALHHRHHRYCPRVGYIPGPVNAMADDCSRLWHLSDSQLLTMFDAQYPQDRPWRLSQPTNAFVSTLISNLYNVRSAPASWDPGTPRPGATGPSGPPSVFAARYRDGRLAPSGRAVRSRTVEDALRSVGQTLARLGSDDARRDAHGNIDFRIQRQLRSFAREDDPPTRVKPIPLEVVQHIAGQLLAGPPAVQATANMSIIGFFFLLRPGEYTGTTSDNAPFRLRDVTFFIGRRRLIHDALLAAPEADLLQATGVALTFTSQKNGVRGEVIHHGPSGSCLVCPVRACARQVLHLRSHTRDLNIPLGAYYHRNRRQAVTAAAITAALRSATAAIGPDLGFLPTDVSARSLRAGGAMALLCADVDTDLIKLLGRWRSDEMLRYLHVQAAPLTQGYAARMFQAGAYRLVPGQLVPVQ